MYRELIFLICLVSWPTITSAQDVNLEWHKAHTTINGFSSGHTVKVGPYGNIYSTGYFKDTILLNGSPSHKYTASADFDTYIQKKDPSGTIIWSKHIKNAGGYFGLTMDVDDSSNIYVAGRFQDTLVLDAFNPSVTLVSNGFSDFFVLKINKNGNLVWAKQSNGLGNAAMIVYQLVIDSKRNPILIGSIHGLLQFNGQILSTFDPPGDFVLKMNSSGAFLWIKRIVDKPGNVDANSVTTDIFNNIYVGGDFNFTADFDAGSGVHMLTSGGYSTMNGFIQKLASDGTFQTVYHIESGFASYNGVYSVCSDFLGRIYALGDFQTANFNNVIDFDPGPGITTVNHNKPGIYLIRLDSTGNLDWFYHVKCWGSSPDAIFAEVDKENSVYISGRYSFKADFDPSPDTLILHPWGNSGNSISFLAKVDSLGTISWAHNLSSGTAMYIRGIDIDSCQNLYLTGAAPPNTDFDLDTGVNNISLSNFGPAYEVRYSQCNSIDTTQIHKSHCDSVTLNEYGLTFLQDTTLTLDLFDNCGCDSVVQFIIEIDQVDSVLIKTTACDSFYWNQTNELYMSSGRYYYTDSSGVNCDSVLILDLEIFESDSTIISKIACESFMWDINGRTYTSSGTYSLVFSNQFGCDSIVSLKLKIDPYSQGDTLCNSLDDRIFIPNSFSPNGDGVNDYFEVFGIPKPFSLIIYNRWGNIVFSSNNYGNNWDGTFQGKCVDYGTFTYFIEYEYRHPRSSSTNSSGSKRQLRGLLNIIP
jgi:gliding motility-associated-like protein